MSHIKPLVLSIAGLDPSGGAGILADIKTFEMHDAVGLGVCTSITFQNENEFDGLEWITPESVRKQLTVLFRKYEIPVVKIGLIESFSVLNAVVDELLKLNPRMRIIWDPILKASAGYVFHTSFDRSLLGGILDKIFLISPNVPEVHRLVPDEDDALHCAEILNRHCHVYLKGGHRVSNDADDILLADSRRFRIPGKRIANAEKHGSGCVLSAAIAANLANGLSLERSCEDAKMYITRFLQSNGTLLGTHLPRPPEDLEACKLRRRRTEGEISKGQKES